MSVSSVPRDVDSNKSEAYCPIRFIALGSKTGLLNMSLFPILIQGYPKTNVLQDMRK